MTDIIDTRDLAERLLELEAEDADNSPLDAAELEERDEIRAIEDAGIADYQYGEALIREDYFTEYAQDLAEDIDAIDRDAAWPLSYIDWDAAAEALKADYIEVEYQGSTYLVRSC